MFGLGWQEILIILVIAVLVIGPEQLPQVARTLGKLMAQFRRASNDLRDTINREFSEHEEFKDFQEFGRSLDSEVRGIGYSAQEFVEKEVAKEEAELRKLEEQISVSGNDASARAPDTKADEGESAAKSTDAAEPEAKSDDSAAPAPEQWVYGPGDFPDEEPASAAGDATESANPAEPVAEHNEPSTDGKDPRKESA